MLETINAISVSITAGDAERLRKDPRVLRVKKNMNGTVQTTQIYPGWGLGRLDQLNIGLNNQYIYNVDGAGQAIYILDTGLDLTNPTVAREFGSRAFVIWDVNGASEQDCIGHGASVVSIAAGNTLGLAKGATVVAAKITIGCTGNSSADTCVLAFNWLATNAPRGTIVNFSSGLSFGNYICGDTKIVQAVEDAIRAAYNAGIIMVVAAGNDGCNTANYTPTRMPETFVVGATDSSGLSVGYDARVSYSRVGSNISVFSPRSKVSAMNLNGDRGLVVGASFAAPYMAGMFAVGCQVVAPFCSSSSSASNSGVVYNGLKKLE